MTPKEQQAKALRVQLAMIGGRDPELFIEVRFRPSLRAGITGQQWFSADGIDAAAEFIATQGAVTDTYLGAAPRLREGGTEADVAFSNVLWAELDRADAAEALKTFDGPPPALVVASGTPGHVHAWWRLAEPVAVGEVKAANARLADALGGDRNAIDPARILRAVGTVNFKPTGGPVRCVQLSKLALNGSRPTAAQLVDALPEPTPDVPSDDLVNLTGGSITEGGRDNWLTSQAGVYRRGGDDPATILAKLAIDNERCQPPLSGADLKRIARSIGKKPAGAARPSGAIGVQWASDVTPRNPTFVWDGRIPLGAVTLLAGLEGLGKSTLTTLLAAQLTHGTLEGDLLGKPGVVLFASHEDSLEETAVPRLIAAGADLSKIGFLATDLDEATGTLVLPDDVERLSQTIEQARARLVIIDPISAYVSGAKRENSEQDVRSVMSACARLAKKHDAAFLCIKHLNKDEGASFLSRVSGSRGYSAAARSILAFGRDPQDDDPRSPARVIAHPKCNVAPQQESLAYAIESAVLPIDGGQLSTSRLVFRGLHEARAEDLVDYRSTPEEGAKVAAAIDWLRDELLGGVRLGTDIREAAKRAGHAQSTLYRARDRLGVQQVAVPGADARVKGWALPALEGSG